MGKVAAFLIEFTRKKVKFLSGSGGYVFSPSTQERQVDLSSRSTWSAE